MIRKVYSTFVEGRVANAFFAIKAVQPWIFYVNQWPIPYDLIKQIDYVDAYAGFVYGTETFDSCSVKRTDSPSLRYVVHPGVIWSKGLLFILRKAFISQPVELPTTNPRIDLVVGDLLTCVPRKVEGEEASNPVAPFHPIGTTPLAELHLTPSTTVLNSSNIVDRRTIATSLTVEAPEQAYVTPYYNETRIFVYGTMIELECIIKPEYVGLYEFSHWTYIAGSLAYDNPVTFRIGVDSANMKANLVEL